MNYVVEREDEITPPSRTLGELSEITADIMSREDHISEIRAEINTIYHQARTSLGVDKAGLKLAVAHARLSQAKLEAIRDGYTRGVKALALRR